MPLTKPYKIDASMLRDFGDCREEFRRKWVRGIVPIKPALHLEFGKAIHIGILGDITLGLPGFWNGASYEESMKNAVGYCELVNQSYWNPKELERWQELVDAIPEMLSAYFNEMEYTPRVIIEQEWHIQLLWNTDIILVGRYDRLELMTSGIRNYDVKTASEIGSNWKEQYRNQALRDCAMSLYDWSLCQFDRNPQIPVLEVIIKPYKSKPARVERIELPEIIAWRKRFEQQLKWRVAELVHYLDNYQDALFWPMNDGSQCVGKYGMCDYISCCNYGSNERIMSAYKQREEHLAIRRINNNPLQKEVPKNA